MKVGAKQIDFHSRHLPAYLMPSVSSLAVYAPRVWLASARSHAASVSQVLAQRMELRELR